MRRQQTLVAAGIIFFALIGTTVQAQSLKAFEIDKDHSAVVFKIKNRGISFVVGRFNDISGTISINKRSRPSELTVTAEVNPRSVDTGVRKRDRHLKGKDFFDTSTFKTIRFETKEFKRQDEDKSKFELTGVLTLLGKKQSMTLIYEHLGVKTMPDKSIRIGGQTSFTLKRSEFGMNHMIPEIADEVTVTVYLEAKLSAQPAA